MALATVWLLSGTELLFLALTQRPRSPICALGGTSFGAYWGSRGHDQNRCGSGWISVNPPFPPAAMQFCGPIPRKPIPKAKSHFSLSSLLGPGTPGPHSGLVKPLSYHIQWALGLHGELWEQKEKWINGIFPDPLPPFPVE